MNDKWVERWAVRSSSGHGDYIIGRDAEGNYGCSCPGWTRHLYCPFCGSAAKKGDTICHTCRRRYAGDARFAPVRRDCVHISQVKAGRGRSNIQMKRV